MVKSRPRVRKPQRAPIPELGREDPLCRGVMWRVEDRGKGGIEPTQDGQTGGHPPVDNALPGECLTHCEELCIRGQSRAPEGAIPRYRLEHYQLDGFVNGPVAS